MGKRKYKREKQKAKQEAQQRERIVLALDKRGNTNQPAKSAKTEDVTDSKEEQFVSFRERFKPSSVTDWWIAAFTTALALASIYQFTIMGRQLRVMKADERAWLFVSTTSTPSASVGSAPSQELSALNIGKSVAKKTLITDLVAIIPNGERPDFSKKAVSHGIEVIGPAQPNASIPVKATRERRNPETGKIEDDPLTMQEMDDLESGKTWIAVWGTASYEDIFGEKHWTRYCFWNSLKPGDYSSQSCTRYNDVGDGEPSGEDTQ